MTQVRVTFTICCLLMIQACKHPLSIQGQGDVIERLLEVRGCTLEEFESESPRCTDNGVTESDYVVSYEAVPRPGWVFTGWFGTVCSTTTEEGYCEYNLPQGFVDFINKEWPGIVLPPTTAVFHEDTGRSIIGSHYSTPILLIAHDSDDHPCLLNQPE